MRNSVTQKIIVFFLSFFMMIQSADIYIQAQEVVQDKTDQVIDEEYPDEGESEPVTETAEPEEPSEDTEVSEEVVEETPEPTEEPGENTEEESEEPVEEEPVIKEEEPAIPSPSPEVPDLIVEEPKEEPQETPAEPQEPSPVIVEEAPAVQVQEYYPSGTIITLMEMPSGYDFTDRPALAEKLNVVFSGYTGITDGNGLSVLAPLGSHAVPPGLRLWACSRGHSGESCFVYALSVYYTLFGEDPYLYADHSMRVAGAVNIRYANKEAFENAGIRNAPGAYFRTDVHSLIVLGYDENSIRVVQGNIGNNGYICITEYTWEEFNQTIMHNGNVGVEVVYQPTDEYFDAVYPSGEEKIDKRDSLNLFAAKIIHTGTSFVYDEDYFLTDTHYLNPELAKISVALSAAAYDQTEITDVYREMGMSEDNIFVENYAKQAEEDPDSAGYSIARKRITDGSGNSYYLYFITVRGTSSKEEWLSNSRLGENGYHEGYYHAADQIREKLSAVLNGETEEEKQARHIFLVTGHDRGAAAANILAGKLSASETSEGFANEENVFGYTFACPAVSMLSDAEDPVNGVRPGLTNIYNFNISDDLMNAMPLSTRGYRRYGVDIELQEDEENIYWQNFLNRFAAENQKEYQKADYETFLSTVNGLMPEGTPAEMEKVMTYYAKIMAEGKTFTSAREILSAVYDTDLSFLPEETVGSIFAAVLENAENDPLEELRAFQKKAEDLYNETAELDKEEFEIWKEAEENVAKLEELKVYITETPEDPQIFHDLSMKMSGAVHVFEDGSSQLCHFLSLFISENGGLTEQLNDIHDIDTYKLWINSLYYGEKGWYGWTGEFKDLNLSGTEMTTDIRSIGESCFYGVNLSGNLDLRNVTAVCEDAFRKSGYESVMLYSSIDALGSYAFGEMEQLRSVTMPVDTLYTWDGSRDTSPFKKDHNLKEVRYTAGKTGEMPDTETPAESYYMTAFGADGILRDEYRIEYIGKDSIETIVYEEGVREINAEAYYPGSEKMSMLTNVELPASLVNTGTLFTDVSDAGQYFYRPVSWAVSHHITSGAGGSGKFSPDDNCTREQIVTFLWRMMGEPEPETACSFSDVSETDWYYKPVAWAFEKGITTGLSDGSQRFGVGEPCTREQCVAFLYRAAGSPLNREFPMFTDVSRSKYYYNAVIWAANNHITTGLNDGTGRFGTGEKCTRAMVVTFLYRYWQDTEKKKYFHKEKVIEGITKDSR